MDRLEELRDRLSHCILEQHRAIKMVDYLTAKYPHQAAGVALRYWMNQADAATRLVFRFQHAFDHQFRRDSKDPAFGDAG
jgi:hypothetical protein